MSSMKMELVKSDLAKLEKQAAAVAETLAAMANPNRLLILCHLASGEKTVNELVYSISLAQSAVSQHLGKMRALKLVKARRNGKQSHYSLASPEVSRIMATLYDIYCAPKPTQKKSPLSH